ncbi:hypothetical protein ACIP5Y_22535 [Nocardia sp. NPDC088792]|uniref:hypothetical protein n=1 Tax=Nocardia sp. NPDC088792 TaxID=3364332 RepID=UPI00381A1911
MYAPVPPGYGAPGQGYGAPNPQPRKGRRWLWPLVAVVVAALVWGVVIAVAGHRASGATARADLRGYHAVDDLCTATDFAPLTGLGFTVSPGEDGAKNPSAATFRHAALDQMGCDIAFIVPGSKDAEYPVTASVGISAALHKQADPGPEFAAAYQSQVTGDFTDDFPQSKVTRVPGLADDAYQVIQPDTEQFPRTDVKLFVRDGWMVYSLTFFEERGSDEINATIPSETDALAMLTTIAKSGMAKLEA